MAGQTQIFVEHRIGHRSRLGGQCVGEQNSAPRGRSPRGTWHRTARQSRHCGAIRKRTARSNRSCFNRGTNRSPALRGRGLWVEHDRAIHEIESGQHVGDVGRRTATISAPSEPLSPALARRASPSRRRRSSSEETGRFSSRPSDQAAFGPRTCSSTTRCRNAGNLAQCFDLSAIFFDQLAADDFLRAVRAPFDQQVGL